LRSGIDLGGTDGLSSRVDRVKLDLSQAGS